MQKEKGICKMLGRELGGAKKSGEKSLGLERLASQTVSEQKRPRREVKPKGEEDRALGKKEDQIENSITFPLENNQE